jgi:methylthioribose-1-phosphate isomerase
MALGAAQGSDEAHMIEHLAEVAAQVRATRPTAVHLFLGVQEALDVAGPASERGAAEVRRALWDLADRRAAEDVLVNQKLGQHGASLVPDGGRLLTHCNAGALATAGWGTALGVVRSACASGLKLHVYVDETRPFLQGSRLTAWELAEERIPYTVITDSMAGALMAQGGLDLCIVGADRIAANGDVANKIGTYSLAVLARAHRIPFYVAAPLSTVDLATKSGAGITIEQRAEVEVLEFAGQRVAPDGARAWHPAFDVTPARLVSGLITEVGIIRPPFPRALARAMQARRRTGSGGKA